MITNTRQVSIFNYSHQHLNN